MGSNQDMWRLINNQVSVPADLAIAAVYTLMGELCDTRE